jgi:hypothetical protein
MRLMSEQDWSTSAGLAAIRQARSAGIPGWEAPVAYAVGFRDGGDWVFPQINRPGGVHGLPAVMLAEVLGYVSGTLEYRLTVGQLRQAIRRLAPAEAATDIDHPNLVAWRAIADRVPAEIGAVFIGALDAPLQGDADRALRPQIVGR